MNDRHVIAVAAPIGGGKSSLARAIAGRLKDATTLHFDHYETITQRSAEDLRGWVERGADLDEFSVPGLAEDLRRLKMGEKVSDPLSKREVPSGKYILFEMPMGREYKETAGLIDLLIWVEIPLDLALARKIREFTSDFPAHHDPGELGNFLAWLNGYLDNYMKVVHRVLQVQRERVCPGADIILDGRSDFESLVEHATREILERLP